MDCSIIQQLFFFSFIHSIGSGTGDTKLKSSASILEKSGKEAVGTIDEYEFNVLGQREAGFGRISTVS